MIGKFTMKNYIYLYQLSLKELKARLDRKRLPGPDIVIGSNVP